ncbi:MAG: DNA primase [Alphaproteobacteria bacterium]|nr:DNA primase [Alphaproteobacteria bacterium]
MRFAPHHLDEIRARLPVSQVVSGKVNLKRQGRELIGLSPFKVEKTPSFTVNDQKGFYHCFATGEHGDIFSFLMKTEGLAFPEAVERLAEEAGVELPKETPKTPEARAQTDHRQRLYELVEASALFFQANLNSSSGTFARQYVERRGLSDDTVARFRLGYAPDGRTTLKQHLAKAGFTVREMVDSGMLIGGEDIREPYDRFRNRLMFPITDLKGRVIAFGGRALDANQPAKYLNSNDTPLFHKGRVLYNAHDARQAAFEKNSVIAVEGYMDVIALAQAGFNEAVAPLGTALTEDQLALLWRMAPEPVLCFDGDGAGRKAAFRAIDTALGHLKPGASLSFAFLADGVDPDDAIREGGPEGLQAILDRARPLADVLFDREWGDGNWTTPERRAGLEQRIKKVISGIGDEVVRSHYERDMRDRLFTAWRRKQPRAHAGGGNSGGPRVASTSQPFLKKPRTGGNNGFARSGQGGQQPYGGPAFASESLKRSSLAAGYGAAIQNWEAVILKCLLNHPFLIDERPEEIAELKLASASLRNLRDSLLSAHALEKSLDRTSLRSHLERLGAGDELYRIDQLVLHRSDRFAEPDAEADAVREGFDHIIALQQERAGLSRPLGTGFMGR